MRLIKVNTLFYFISEAVVRRCSVKKMFLEISHNSQENTCARVSFLVKLQVWGPLLYFIKKRVWRKCSPVNFAKFLRTPLVAASATSKYFHTLYGNVVHKMQIQMSNFIQAPALLVFAAISEFWFSGFSKHTIYKLITLVTAFLIAFLIKTNNKKLHQTNSKLLTWSKYFTCSLRERTLGM